MFSEGLLDVLRWRKQSELNLKATILKMITHPRSIIMGIMILVSSLVVNAQDIHWTQYYNSPMNLNPSLTGIFGGNTRIMANLRQQWADVPVPYTTLSAAFDTKLSVFNTDNSRWAVGGLINWDRAGDGQLSLFELGLNGSYTRTLNPNNFVTGGLQLGFGQRSFKIDELTFPSQWGGDQFQPGQANNENFSNTSKFLFKLGAGANYHWQKTARTKVNVGLAAMNINQPKTGFYDNDDITLPMRLNLVAFTSWQLTSSLDLKVNAVGQFQDQYEEILIGAAIKHHISKKRGNNLAIQLGLEYRFGDAFAPVAHLFWNEWMLGVSYDINFSDFDVATNGVGGPELAVRYIITNVQASEFKICPIY